MSIQHFTRSISLRRPARDVFAWHERPGALERLTPPWEQVEVLERSGGIRDGGRVVLRSQVGPCAVRWELSHHGYDEARQFCDRQVKGPFALWEHRHVFTQDGPAACRLTDSIDYRLPRGGLGGLAGPWVRRKLERLFAYRQTVMAEDLEMAAGYGSVRPMRFLVTGTSGLVGRALVPFLRSQGHEVVRLVRTTPRQADELFWDPRRGGLDLSHQRPIDVVVHLAGAGVAERRWTARRREAIRASRVLGTRTLVAALDPLRHRPFALITASAVGIYGDTEGRDVYEEDRIGSGFLADVCADWEKEAAAARGLGIRVAKVRFGAVLSPAGGLLGRMLPVFSAGLGGAVGSGRQWVSWISIDDALGTIYHAVLDQRCSGPLNGVSPEPVTNREFAATLARVLRRPALLPAPAALCRLGFGAMADELLLAGQRVRPGRLEETRYRFRHRTLEEALRHILGRPLK